MLWKAKQCWLMRPLRRYVGLCKKAPFLFCPEPTRGHWEAHILPPSFPLLFAALVPGNPAFPQLIKLSIFRCLRGAFSYSRWEGKPALSFLSFPVFSPGSAGGTGQQAGGEEGKLGLWPAEGKEISWLYYPCRLRSWEKEKGFVSPLPGL